MHVADLSTQDQLTPEAVLSVLRVGEANGMTANELVRAVIGHSSAADERRLRQVIEVLSSNGHRICALPGHGYFLAANEEELERACRFLRDRAMTSLRRESAMRRIALPDLLGQLRLTDERSQS